jgi:zinc transporter
MNESDLLSPDGLISAYRLDGRGGGREVGWEEVRASASGAEPAEAAPAAETWWVHLDHSGEEARRWLREESGIEPLAVAALLSDETRPRCTPMDGGLLLNLRGVNLNPGADPEDMVSLRVWIDEGRIVTVRRRRLLAVEDVRDALRQGTGPGNASEVLVRIAERLGHRMGGVITDLDDRIDELEREVLESESRELRPRIAEARRETIDLRRYLSPQREAFAQLLSSPGAWLDEAGRQRIREVADRTTRYVEDLDSIRDRLAVTQEELASRLSEQMNQRMYVLSIITGIFLPLGFLTGLLGINVGGMPGVDSPTAFALVCGLLVAIVVVEVWYFRKRGWMGSGGSRSRFEK